MKQLQKILVVCLLLSPGVALYGQSFNKKLHIPASKGDLKAVQKAIEKGMKIDRKDIAGQTALMYASEGGHFEVVKYLVEQGADVNAESGNAGRGTALIYAAAANKYEVAEYLLENGANIDATTPVHNETALVWAVAFGHERMIKMLLEKGADKTIKNKEGKTVEDLAKELGKDLILELLSKY